MGKEELIKELEHQLSAAKMRNAGNILILVFGLLTILALIGIIIFPLALWMMSKERKNINRIKEELARLR